MIRDQNFGRRVQELRVARGLSKSELARRVSVTPTAVWNWEKNNLTPREPTFTVLARLLGVTNLFLRTGMDGEDPSPVASPVPSPRTVAVIIEQARNDIAACTGMELTKVRVNVEFVSG
jgi:transcriptional regulator with XRE-family HTH domain